MYVYILTNTINHKQYVGQTNSISHRMANHRRVANTDSPNSPIARAIKKYGWDSFHLYYVECPIDIVDEFETELIELLGTVENGYNVRIGGHFFHGRYRRK